MSEGRTLTCYGLGRDEKSFLVCVIEVGHAFPGELEVLLLVIANRHMRGTVDEDIGSLQDGVRE